MKLLRLLQTFGEKELKDFEKYLRDPLTKSKRDIRNLFDLLSRDYLSVPHKNVSFEDIFSDLFPNEKYVRKKNKNKDEEIDSYKRIDNLTAALSESAKNFMIKRFIEQDEIQRLLILSQIYLERGLPEEANGLNITIHKKLNGIPKARLNYATNLKKLRDLEYSHDIHYRNYERTSESLNNNHYAAVFYFLIEFMNLRCEKETTKANYGKTIENSFVDKLNDIVHVKNWLSFYDNKETIAKLHLKLHYQKYKTIIAHDKHRHYWKLKDMVLKNIRKLDHYDQYFFFMHMSNYVSQKIDMNVEGFEKEGLNIFKAMKKHEVFRPSKDRPIDYLLFRNVVLNCISKEEANWLEKFIREYSNELHPVYRDNLKTYADSHLQFLKGEYERCLEISAKTREVFFYFKTDMEMLVMKCQYSLVRLEDAHTTLKYFSLFINRNKKVYDDYRKMYNGFIKGFKVLLKARELLIESKSLKEGKLHTDGISKMEAESYLLAKKLLEELDVKTSVADKNWLKRGAVSILESINLNKKVLEAIDKLRPNKPGSQKVKKRSTVSAALKK
jgi:hypothetical protein